MRRIGLTALLLVAGVTGALAFDAAFTDAMVRSGERNVRACTAPVVEEKLDCVATAFERAAQSLETRPDYIPAAAAFRTAARKIRAARALPASTAPKQKIAIARAAVEEAGKQLLSASGGKSEITKLSRVPETAKGVLKA